MCIRDSPLCCSPWGRCIRDEVISQPSFLNKPSDLSCSPCPFFLQNLSPPWTPSSGHTRTVWCPYIVASRSAHNTPGEAVPAQSRERQSPLDGMVMLCLVLPRAWLALCCQCTADSHSTCQQTKPPYQDYQSRLLSKAYLNCLVAPLIAGIFAVIVLLSQPYYLNELFSNSRTVGCVKQLFWDAMFDIGSSSHPTDIWE